jgi:ubiquitin fusion degradation protein 1
MKTLELEVGDLLQVKTTDLPPGTSIKLKPQSPDFLDISDPRAVLEKAFRNFSCLTKGDIFSFAYNDNVYNIAVTDVQPDTDKHGIVTMETDLKVEFEAPVGYVEPERKSGTSTPLSNAGMGRKGGTVHFQGTMAQSINYASIKPGANEAAKGEKALSSNFLTSGHTLKKGGKAPTPKASTPVAGASTNAAAEAPRRKTNGPQPLRLPPGKLFFGYEVKPLKKKGQNGETVGGDEVKPTFQGVGQTLRKKKGGDAGSGVDSDAEKGKKR